MKQVILSLTLTLLAFIAISGNPVSREDALRAGQSFLESNTGLVYAGTVSGKSGPALYAFNSEPAGFILISADDAAWPVAAYAREGRWNGKDQPGPVSDWISRYVREIDDIRERSLPGDPATSALWEQLLDGNGRPAGPCRDTRGIQPLLISEWDQKFPYNALCPADAAAGLGYNGHVPAGCTATALAMIMQYWRYPSHGWGYHCIEPEKPEYGPQCADFANTAYDWNGTVSHPAGESQAAALVAYHLGVALDMNYSPMVSVADMEDVPAVMTTYFGYANTIRFQEKADYTYSQWIMTLKNNLNAGQPILYGSDGNPGHAFICDGYEGNDYFHFNWGWGGLYNGYYYLNNLNPGNQNYNNYQRAVVFIKPDPGKYPGYCDGQTVITHPEGSLEDGSGPVANYGNMEDCTWRITPDDSVKNITLHFNRFGIGAVDQVSVYDGSDEASPLIGTYSGNTPPADITSSGPGLLVRLTSWLSSPGQGFLAEYTSDPYDLCVNDTMYTSPEGDIGDGSGRFNYRNDSYCSWLLVPQGMETLTLTFSEFNTEYGKDIVKIRDLSGSQPLAELSGDLSGNLPVITSLTGKMVVEFSTNESGRFPGWKAHYTTTVGVPGHKGIPGISVVPNPVTGEARVFFASRANAEYLLTITDGTGRIVRSGTIQGSPYTFSREGLPSGLYNFIILDKESAVTGIARVVLQ